MRRDFAGYPRKRISNIQQGTPNIHRIPEKDGQKFLVLSFELGSGEIEIGIERNRKGAGTIAIPMVITTPIPIVIPNSDTDSDLDGINPKASAGGEILNLERAIEYPISNKELPIFIGFPDVFRLFSAASVERIPGSAAVPAAPVV